MSHTDYETTHDRLMRAEAERDALAAELAETQRQLKMVAPIGKYNGRDIEGWAKHAGELEAALREDRADFDAINAMESVYRIDKVLGTAPETPAKPANETLARSALGNLLAAVIKFGPIDADIEFAMREARQVMGFPFTSDRAGGK